MIDDADVFGTSDRNPLVGEIHCVGTEPELFECSHTSIGIHSCGRDADPVPDVAVSCYGMYFHRIIRASVDALSRDGTDMRGDAQNPKSFQAPRM